MWISKAFAATADNTVHLDALSEAPSAFDAFVTNVGLLVVLMALFYVLLIMPQQRRFKEHNKMLGGLKKGDRVVTGGGLIGKVDKIIDDHEVLIDLGNDIKVTALRSTIQSKSETFLKQPEKSQEKPKKDETAAPKSKKKAADKASKE